MSVNQWKQVNLWESSTGSIIASVAEVFAPLSDSSNALISLPGEINSSIIESLSPLNDASTANIGKIFNVRGKNVKYVRSNSNIKRVN